MNYRQKVAALMAFAAIPALALGCGSASEGTVGIATQSTLDQSGLKGSWYRSSANETIDFAESGSFTSTACATRGTVQNLDPKAQTYLVTQFSVGNAGCPTPADRSCSYSITGTTLTLTCTPDGSGTYQKP